VEVEVTARSFEIFPNQACAEPEFFFRGSEQRSLRPDRVRKEIPMRDMGNAGSYFYFRWGAQIAAVRNPHEKRTLRVRGHEY